MSFLLALWVSLCPLLPADGPIVAPFGPTGPYSGHWGIDIGVAAGSPVRSPAPGIVSWAGSVAGNLSVTIDHGGGVRSSVSSLSVVSVSMRQHVGRGALIGTSGVHHGEDRLHVSLRVHDTYLDPTRWFQCRYSDVGGALRLEPRRDVYPSVGATWHSRRHIRSSPYGSPGGWRGRLS